MHLAYLWRTGLRLRLTVLCFLALLAVIAPAAWAGARYIITDLGTLGGSGSAALAINSSGQVVGLADGTDGYFPFLYGDGVMLNLGTLPGVGSGRATAISQNGKVAGFCAGTLFGSSHSFLYSGGVVRDLGIVSGNPDYAYGVNDSGQVVGSAENRAFLYQDGRLSDLGTLGGLSSIALAINNRGLIVGSADVPGVPYGHAFLYSEGHMADLGTLSGGRGSSAQGINDSGQVVGWSYLQGTASAHAFLYDGGVMTDLGTLPGAPLSEATSINNFGEIVGFTRMAAGQRDRAFFYSNGAMVDLNALISPTSGWWLTEAMGINDRGEIVGSGFNASGYYRAFLLTPIPEPGVVALVALGCANAVLHRRLALNKGCAS